MKGIRLLPDPFEMKSKDLLFMEHLTLVKTNFIKQYCGLYETVNVFRVDTRDWKGYKTFSVIELDLFKNPEDFANSLVIFDDMGDNIRMPVVDKFYSSGRHNNFNIISVGHSVTD